jgi:carboxymethylenebutenolidase
MHLAAHAIRALIFAAAAGAAGCAGEGAREGDEQPTSAIPDAILGTAPAPGGQALHYVPDDTLTTGYLAVPDGTGPFPALILIHEWNGLSDRVRQVADAFAAQGYVALAADVFRGRMGSTRDENMALVREAHANPDALIANLDAAQRYLRERPDVTGRVGVMGWCFGGGVALSYALGGEHHDATAIFYGSLVTDPAELARLDHPVYGTFAEMDQGIPAADVERFAAALDSMGIHNDIHVYDAVHHGFWLRVEEDRATREAPATDAWNRLLAFLGRVLG